MQVIIDLADRLGVEIDRRPKAVLHSGSEDQPPAYPVIQPGAPQLQ
jgi:hypothetical protein